MPALRLKAGLGSVVAVGFFLQPGRAFTGHVGRVRSPRNLNTAIGHYKYRGEACCWTSSSTLGRSRLFMSSATEAQQSADTLPGDGEPLTRQVRSARGV